MSAPTSTTAGEPGPRHDGTAVDPALVERVRKLLAMAEGSPNPHEADAFSRKAAELIAAHRIDPVRLRASSSGDELGVRTFPMGRGAYVRARIALLQAVAEAHGCTLVFAPSRSGTTAFVAGYCDDLDATQLLHSSLHAQASARLSREHRATPAATQRWRRSFLFGYADQVRRMLEQSRDDAVRSEPTGTVLPMLRARDQRVAEYARTAFGRVVAARAPSAATESGWRAGRAAAEQADLGRQRLPATRAALGRGA